MVRPMLIQSPGADYPVMARGNQGKNVFDDDRDRWRFLEERLEGARPGPRLESISGGQGEGTHDRQFNRLVRELRLKSNEQ